MKRRVCRNPPEHVPLLGARPIVQDRHLGRRHRLEPRAHRTIYPFGGTAGVELQPVLGNDAHPHDIPICKLTI